LSFTSYPLRGIWDCPTGPDNTGTKVLLFQVNHGQNPRMGFELRKKGDMKEQKNLLKG